MKRFLPDVRHIFRCTKVENFKISISSDFVERKKPSVSVGDPYFFLNWEAGDF